MNPVDVTISSFIDLILPISQKINEMKQPFRENELYEFSRLSVILVIAHQILKINDIYIAVQVIKFPEGTSWEVL